MKRVLSVLLLTLSVCLLSSCFPSSSASSRDTAGVSGSMTKDAAYGTDTTSSPTDRTEETFAVETTSGDFAAATDSTGRSSQTVSVTAPDGWKKDNHSPFLLRYTKGSASFIVAEETFFSKADIDTVKEEAVQMLTSVFDQSEISGDPAELEVDGYPAIRLTMTCTVNGVPMTYDYTYICIDGHVFSAVLSDSSDLWPETSADADNFRESLRLN